MDSFFPEDVIDTLSKTFWQRVSAMKGLIERHQSFRLLWFGEALSVTVTGRASLPNRPLIGRLAKVMGCRCPTLKK
ncbi:hypothetical protein WDV93_04475 [Pantoea ananatis]